jgi:hypothetical protein
MAVITEYLINAALNKNPGLKFAGFNDLRVLKGIVLKSNEIVNLEITSTIAEKSGNEAIAKAELRTTINGKTIVNAHAEVVLCEELPQQAPAADFPQAHLVYPHSMNEAYTEHLFHGEFLQALTKVNGWSEAGIIADVKTALPPANWFDSPIMDRWQTDPLILDSAYQLMILWTIEAAGGPSLPSYAKKYRQYQAQFPSSGVKIVASASKQGAAMANAQIDFVDSNNNLIARLEGYQCVINPALKQAFQQRKASGAE